jgi:hypothetical protein
MRQHVATSCVHRQTIKIKKKTFNFIVYGCETWSLTLREETRLRMFDNRVLRRVFGPMRDEVTGEWRKLHNEEPKFLYTSPIFYG